MGIIYKEDRPFDLYSGSQAVFTFTASLSTASATLDLDAVLCFPLENEFFIGTGGSGLGNTNIAYVLGDKKQYYVDSTPSLGTPAGSLTLRASARTCSASFSKALTTLMSYDDDIS